MAVLVSQVIVLILGITVFGLSAWGIYSPDSLVKMVTRAMNQIYGMYIAVIVRLLLGVTLIIVAPVSRFPTVFNVLGWIAIIAAGGLILIGQENVGRFVAWFERFSKSIIRLWLLLGMAFAGFLIYGVL